MSAQQAFEVSIINRAPATVGTLPAIEITVGESRTVGVSGAFTDPDGDALTYSAASTDVAVATASTAGTVVTVTAASQGRAVVTVTATDGGGLSAAQSFAVSVPNQAPVAVGELEHLYIRQGESRTVDFSEAFNDPDGDPLSYTAVSSMVSVAAVSAAGTIATVTGVGPGEVQVTLVATDTDNRSATQEFGVTVQSGATPEDRIALEILYRATDGPNWDNNEGWLTDAPLGEWYGVTTNDRGRVTHVNLGGWNSDAGRWVANGLTGTIPPILGTLANLESLSLWGNALSGRIPSELGGLANLSYLNFGGNELSGRIPSELGGLANLYSLFLDYNDLSGRIPPTLGNLRSLRHLYLDHNDLSGGIPPELGALTNLQHLNLWSNDFSGQIPPELGSLANLVRLDLSHNDLTGRIPRELGNLLRLQFLWLESNGLTGPIPPELGRLTNLTLFVLYSNRVSGPIPSELGNLSGLTSLPSSGKPPHRRYSP